MVDFEFEFQYAEGKARVLRQTSGWTLRGALRRQRMRKVHTAAVHQRTDPTVLRGRAEGLLPPERAGHRRDAYRLGELAASVFQDPRSQFFTVNSSNEVAFGLENHGLPQEKIRRRVDEAFRVFAVGTFRHAPAVAVKLCGDQLSLMSCRFTFFPPAMLNREASGVWLPSAS